MGNLCCQSQWTKGIPTIIGRHKMLEIIHIIVNVTTTLFWAILLAGIAIFIWVKREELIRLLDKIIEEEGKKRTAGESSYQKLDGIGNRVGSGEDWTKPFLMSLEWKRYEEVCMEYLRIRNCKANVTCVGADGGIDIKISDSNGVVFAVGQCKAWNKPIGVNLIRELYGVMASERVKTGIFLTTSSYTNDALEFAKGKNLLLIDSDELITLINGLDDASKKQIDRVATSGDYTTPTCVNCNVKMIKRTIKNGDKAGKKFWGCSNFPKCRNTLQIRKEA